jgi:glycerophosphoryl diester phosphodiesterase
LLKKFAFLLFFRILPIAILVYVLLNAQFGVQINAPLNGNKPMVFAHRGLTLNVVENSKESFDLAKEYKLLIETDVNLSKDQVPIIFHDNNGKRLLNINEEIKSLDFPKIKENFLTHKDTLTQNEVLSLEEYIVMYKDIITYLDIKISSKSMADSLIHLIEKYDLYNTVIVADANFAFLAYIKMKNSKIITALEGFDAEKEWVYYMIPNSLMPDYFAGFLNKTSEDFFEFLEEKDLLDRFIAYGIDETNFGNKNFHFLQHYITDYIPNFELE